jgi:hypothetical protein
VLQIIDPLGILTQQSEDLTKLLFRSRHSHLATGKVLVGCQGGGRNSGGSRPPLLIKQTSAWTYGFSRSTLQEWTSRRASRRGLQLGIEATVVREIGEKIWGKFCGSKRLWYQM